MAAAASIQRPGSQDPQPHAWPRVTVRPAVRGELPRLHDLLPEQADYFEQNPLDQSIVFVADYDGGFVGFIAARLQWQVEPLLLTKGFKEHAPESAKRKATYLLISAIDGWLGDRTQNKSGCGQSLNFSNWADVPRSRDTRAISVPASERPY